MNSNNFTLELTNEVAYGNAVKRLREASVILPTFSELADAGDRLAAVTSVVDEVDPDDANAANLLRVHWYNDSERRELSKIPGYMVLDKALTGVDAPIVVILGERFPMIGAHKVMPAYACLVTRLVSGQFDPTTDRAIWPSTGNYCRGGIAISRILGCRGVAVLPAGMSQERFDWLEKWVASPDDIIRTPGSESNVKEIYDKCNELAQQPDNVIINQFSEFANYLIHFHCTGRALERAFQDFASERPEATIAAFVAGTGSAGTLAAGDYLKRYHGTKIVAVEPTECPTMLSNGYGEHNIQGIGDKHIPLIQNVMNCDLVVGVSDASSDHLDVLFNTEAGRSYLKDRRNLDPALVDGLSSLGFSGIANVLSAIKVARQLDYTENDVVVTVATDSARLYGSERESTLAKSYPAGFDAVSAGEVFGEHMLGVGSDHVLELTHQERRRIFNLGYYTWVEQQGIALEDFDKRLDQKFWREIQDSLPHWDAMIEEFNRRTGVNRPG